MIQKRNSLFFKLLDVPVVAGSQTLHVELHLISVKLNFRTTPLLRLGIEVRVTMLQRLEKLRRRDLVRIPNHENVIIPQLQNEKSKNLKNKLEKY